MSLCFKTVQNFSPFKSRIENIPLKMRLKLPDILNLRTYVRTGDIKEIVLGLEEPYVDMNWS